MAQTQLPLPDFLRNAIDTAPPHRLRRLMQAVCEQIPTAKNMVEQELTVDWYSDDALSIRDNPTDTESEEEESESESESDPEDYEDYYDEEDEDGYDDEEPHSDDETPANNNNDKDEDEGKANEQKLLEATTTAVWQTSKRPRPRYATCVRCGEEYDVSQNGKRACGWHEGTFGPDAGFIIESGLDPNEPWVQEEHPDQFIWDCCGREGEDAKACKVSRHQPESNHKQGNKRSRLW